MEWKRHNKWAEKMDVSEEVSNAVNSLVDDIGDGRLSTEFEREKGRIVSKVTSEEKEVAKGNSAFDRVVEYHVSEHDSARKLTTDSTIYSQVQRKFLHEKGEEYVKAWYLHHHLDYLWEERNSGKSLEQLLEEYRRKYPQTFSPEVEDFLTGHEKELKKELGL